MGLFVEVNMKEIPSFLYSFFLMTDFELLQIYIFAFFFLCYLFIY